MNETIVEKETFTVYKKRFLILFLVSSLQFITSFQATQYTIIANVVTDYYHVSFETVTLTAVIAIFANGVLIIPASWTLKNYGLRNVFVISALFDCIATTIKCFAIKDTLFWLTLVAQSFDGFALAGVTSMSMQISRVWFPQHEVARASTVSLMAHTVGSLLSSFIPVVLVPNTKIKENVASGLAKLFVGQAIYSFVVFLIALSFFEDKPKSPPSKAEKEVQDLREDEPFLQQMLNICSPSLIAIAIANGLVALDKGSLKILFNQMLINTFDNNLYWISLVSILFAISKMISSYTAAHFLDVTHRYKQLILVLAPITALLFAFFGFSFYLNCKALIIILPILIGFAYGPFQSTFLNLASEITYPAPESVSTAVIIFVMEIFRLFSVLFSWIQTQFGNIVLVTVMGVTMLYVFIISLFVKSELRRQKQEDGNSYVKDTTLQYYQNMGSELITPSEEATQMLVP